MKLMERFYGGVSVCIEVGVSGLWNDPNTSIIIKSPVERDE